MVAGAAFTHTHLNHRDMETQRAHRAHRNLTADHADRRRWIQASLKQVARSRPLSDNGRRPEDRATTPNASIRRRFPVLRPALEASAGLATPHPLVMNGVHNTFQTGEERGGTDAPLARRFRRHSSALQYQGDYLSYLRFSCAAGMHSCLGVFVFATRLCASAPLR